MSPSWKRRRCSGMGSLPLAYGEGPILIAGKLAKEGAPGRPCPPKLYKSVFYRYKIILGQD